MSDEGLKPVTMATTTFSTAGPVGALAATSLRLPIGSPRNEVLYDACARGRGHRPVANAAAVSGTVGVLFGGAMAVRFAPPCGCCRYVVASMRGRDAKDDDTRWLDCGCCHCRHDRQSMITSMIRTGR